MTRFLDQAPPTERFERLFKDPAYVPHVADARHTQIYRSRVMELQFLEDDMSLRMKDLQSGLDRVRAKRDHKS